MSRILAGSSTQAPATGVDSVPPELPSATERERPFDRERSELQQVQVGKLRPDLAARKARLQRANPCQAHVGEGYESEAGLSGHPGHSENALQGYCAGNEMIHDGYCLGTGPGVQSLA